MKTAFIVEEILDSRGNQKEMSDKIKGQKYFLKSVKIGKSALLINTQENTLEGMGGIQTSLVTSIQIWDNRINIITMNTTYCMLATTYESGKE